MTEYKKKLGERLLGVGLYTPIDVELYTGISSANVRRWLFGYRANGKYHEGIWSPELSASVEDTLSFHDLLEIRFVNAFRNHGVSLQSIRRAFEHAQDIFGQDYPFTCRRFQTDGRSIFAEIQEETGDESLMDIVKKQYVFKQVIGPSLYEGIEYGVNDTALRWFPVKNSKKIVMDPERNFGKPTLTEFGVSVEAITSAWHAEGEKTRRVASIYNLPISAVEAAIRFDTRVGA